MNHILHNIHKHFAWVSHSDLKRLSTTGNIFRLGIGDLCTATLLRAVRTAVAVSAGFRHGRRTRTQRGYVAVWSAALTGHAVFETFWASWWATFNKKIKKMLIDYTYIFYLYSVST